MGLVCAIVSALVIGAFGSLQNPAVAQTGSVAKKRAEASRISEQLDRLSEQMNSLNEDFLDAQVRLEKLQQSNRDATVELRAQESKLDRLVVLARDQALQVYAQPAQNSFQILQGSASMGDFERQTIYERQIFDRDRDYQDQLRTTKEDLSRSQASLRVAEKDAAATKAILEKKRAEADRLFNKYEGLQKTTNVELQQLIKEEEVRRRREEAALVQRQLEQRRADAKKKLEARLAQERATAKAEREQAIREREARRSGSKTTVKGSSTNVVAAAPTTKQAKTKTTKATELSDDQKLALEAGLVAEAPAASGGAVAVQVALAQVGKPYVWGADGPGSFDCSGLMLYAWRAAGRSLPHSSRIQYSSTKRVPVSQVKPGDLLFYGSPIHHVGMYIGGGQMVEASRRGRPVRTSSIFRRDMVGVGRL